MKTTASQSRELLQLCCRALWEKKAEDLRVLDVGEESSITDYLVLATGTSEPHLRALRGELELALKASGTRLVGVDTTEQSGWTVVDAFDVMVHLFTPEQREHYGLENLWKDAKEVRVADLLPPPPQPEAAPEAKPAFQPQPQPKPKAKAKAKGKVKPKAKAKPKPKGKSKPKPKAKVKPKKSKPAKRRS
jgi:ribosome-associated protein